jgi:PAS domain S-box-containing protein
MIGIEYEGRSDTAVLDGFHGCFQSNPVGVFVIDTEGRLRHVNQRACEILGLAGTQDAEGKPLSHLEFFFSQPIVARIYGLLNGEQSFKVNCFPGTNLAGHFAHYCLSCNRIAGQDGCPGGIFGVIEDVSDHVKRQQELKNRVDELSVLSQVSQEVSSAIDTEEVLKVILTGVTARQGLGFNRAFLFLLDDDGKMLEGRLAVGPADAAEAGRIWSSLEKVDRSLPEILSLYQEESERNNRNLNDLVHEMRIDSTNGSLFARALQERTPLVIGYGAELDRTTERILDHLGERCVAMTPLVTRDRPIGLLIVDNAITHKEITEHDRQFLKLIADQTAAAVERSYLYRDLRERAVELEEMNRKLAKTQDLIIQAEKMSVIGEITSAVAHELRNPLTIIGGFANLMYKNLEPGSSDAEYLNIIISETHRAEAVLTDVLDFSKASRTKDRELDLNEMVQKAVDMLCVRIGNNGRCRIQKSLAPEKLTIWGNPDQLLHALYQIFWVMMQEMPSDVTPRISTALAGDTGRIEVRCLRPGKHRDRIEKLLKQYFGASNNTMRLSLIVAEETLKHHGGSMAVESTADDGPMLGIHVPLYKEKADG